MGMFSWITKPIKKIIDGINEAIDFICKCKMILRWFADSMSSLFCYMKQIIICPLQYSFRFLCGLFFCVIRSIISFVSTPGEKAVTDAYSMFDEMLINSHIGNKCFTCKPFYNFPIK